MKKKKKKTTFQEDVIKAFKKTNRELQMERNGEGQWVVVNKPHKNLKKYDRKRDKKNHNSSYPFNFYH